MPNASRRECEYPGCVSGPPREGQDTNGPYLSHPECTTRAEVSEDIKNHVEMVHSLPLKQQQVQVEQYKAKTERIKVQQNNQDDDVDVESVSTASGSTANHRKSRVRLDTIPRPKIQSNSTASDWSFFAAQWARYVDGSDMTDLQQINQLWASCSEDLQRSLHNGSVTGEHPLDSRQETQQLSQRC